MSYGKVNRRLWTVILTIFAFLFLIVIIVLDVVNF